MEQSKILITDDEKDIRTMVQMMLDKEGFETATACNGRDAIEKVKESPDFHLIIMDIIMPELNGIEAASEIRKYTDCPILFLTAKSADEDKIKAYDSGGDDYLVKPFSRVELILRVRALLKRYGKENKKIGGISLNVSRRILEKNGQRIQLTEKEFDLLDFLYQHKGVAFNTQELYEQIWKEEVLPSSANTVMVHILKIRKKIEDDYTHPKYIQTVWGKGYCYVEPEV
ncbi:MAG: response regulator transcription factor [Anaerobutyricum sp.]|nr:response regulator transcription factor [Anaerobutyricum sp.]